MTGRCDILTASRDRVLGSSVRGHSRHGHESFAVSSSQHVGMKSLSKSSGANDERCLHDMGKMTLASPMCTRGHRSLYLIGERSSLHERSALQASSFLLRSASAPRVQVLALYRLRRL